MGIADEAKNAVEDKEGRREREGYLHELTSGDHPSR